MYRLTPTPAGIAVAIDYSLKERSYGSFHRELRELLAVNPAGKHVRGTPVLAEQRKGQPPARWIHIKLVGNNKWRDKTTIAMRDDNLYLVGFQNNSGSWFVFKGCKGEFPAKVSASASELPFGDSYGDLVQGHRNLAKYDMDKQSALDAVRLLAKYRHKYYDDDDHTEKLKVALAQLCVMLAEGARFKSIFNTLHEKWNLEEANQDQQAMKKAQEATGTITGSTRTSGIVRKRRPTKTNKDGQEPTPTCRISAQQAKEVVHWGSMSLSLLQWAKYDELFWPQTKLLEELGIVSPSDALDKLNLLLWPQGFYFDTLWVRIRRILFEVQEAPRAH